MILLKTGSSSALAVCLVALVPAGPSAGSEIHWTIADSPKQVTANLAVPVGTTLRIDPGVQVQLGSGIKINVAGQVFAEGTADSMIVFDRIGSTGSWGGISINHSSDGVVRPSSIRFAKLVNVATAVDVNGTGNSDILVEDCVIDSWTNLAFHWDNGTNKLHINRCRCGLNTPSSLWGHEAVNGYRSFTLLEHCTFGPRSGYNDTIDLGNCTWGGPVPTIQYNDIGPGEDDGIDFDGCDGYIIGNFIHGRRPPANYVHDSECPQYPIAGGNSNGGGITGNEGSRPMLINNIIFDCFQGIGLKNKADPTIINNTIVHCTFGIVLFETSDIANPDVAHGTLVNNLIWDIKPSLGAPASPIKLRWCETGPLSTADVSYCLVQGGWPGTGNINLTESPFAEVPSVANPTREQFRLRSCSPAIDAGSSATLALSFHTQPIPTTDSDQNPRLDMTSVIDTGKGGTSTFFDIGAKEYQGPDDPCTPPPARFLRGDANKDGKLDISDPVKVLFVLFAGDPTDCKDALDVNDDEALDVADVTAILDYLFLSGPAPSAPFPAIGPDPAGDALDCTRS